MDVRTKIFRTMLACGVSIGAIMGQGAVAQAAGQGQTSEVVPQVAEDSGEIVVTAQKRSERLGDVPAAVTAVSADQLQAAGAVSLRDLSATVPGLQVAGGVGSGAFTIRGITSGNDGNSTVGMQVDGIPIGPAAFGAAGGSYMPELDPSILSQVEVLRGPQGTLYGSSTLGGIVNYVTRRPNLGTMRGSVFAEGAATRHGDLSGTLRGTISAPVVAGRIALQVSGFASSLGGFVDSPANGRSNVNDRRTLGGRVTLTAEVTPDIRITLSNLYSRVKSQQDFVVYDPATRRPLVGDLVNNDAVPYRYDNEFNMLSLNIDGDLGWATLSSITSYQTMDSRNLVDFTAARLGFIATNFLPLYGGVVLPTPANPGVSVELGTDKFTQEIRLTSPDTGPFKWVAGLFYNHETSRNAQIVASYDSDGKPRAGALSSLIRYDLLTNYTEFAAFGNATYSLTPELDVTGGVRAQFIDQDYRQLYSGSDAAALNALFVDSGLAATPADSGLSKAKDSVVTYLANVRYRIAADTMVYFRFATGFRPGGPNIVIPGLPTTFEPDTTYDYALGIKAGFWGGRGFVDLSLYNIDWKNIQILTFSNGINGQTNGGSATSRGVEAALRLEPIDGLKLAGTLAYSDAQLNQTIAGGLGNKGDRMPMNPKWSGSASADYEWALGGDLRGFAGISANFAGKRRSGFESSLIYAQYVLPDYMLVNLRAGVRSEGWDLSLFVRNAGDTRAQLGATTTGSNIVAVQRPRTFGAAIGARF